MKTNIDEILLHSRFIKQKGYWLKKLTPNMKVTELIPNGNHNRLSLHAEDKEEVDILINDNCCRKLLKFAKQSELSTYIILLTVLKLVIYRYTDSRDITVISPLYQPNISEMTLNRYLFLHDEVSPDIPFIDLLLKVRQSVLEAFENQDYPSDKLLEHLYDTPANPAHLTGKEISRVLCLLTNIHSNHISRNPENKLVFSFEMENDRVRGKVLYHPGIYENSYVEKIPGYFTRVLEYTLENIRTEISKIPLLSKQERELLIFAFNDTQSAYPGERTIHGWFEEQVEKTPGRIAAAAQGLEESCAVTYRELNQRANRLAWNLEAVGVTRGSMAAIMTEPSIGMLTAILAVLKTGAAYLPIDHEYPVQRIKYIIKDSHAGWLLMSQYLTGDIKELAPQLPVQVIILMADEAGGPGNNTNPEKDSHPGDAVYLIYTSGSTGNPKGVVLEHRNLVNYVDWFSNTVNITARDKTILTSSFAFDLGYTSLYTSLLKGCELHLLPREIYLLPEGFLEYIKREEITYLKMTPSHFSNLVNHNHFPGGYCQSLRLVVLGGEPIDVNDVETVRALYRSIQVMNHYGPTEATIGSVAVSIEFSRFEAYMDNPVIGKPIFNTSVYILDRDLNLLPVGAAGELCISGACLARGYLNQPELTAEKFNHDLWNYLDYHDEKNKSFCGGPGGSFFKKSPLAAGGKRIYKTGDLARWLSDGNIQFLGRTDTQVKIRGYRIELGEIENQLIEHHQVEKALVIIKEAPVKSSDNEHGDNYLYAYIVPPSTDTAINITGFREYLAERLPGYMIPAYFIQMNAFPLTPNGKVDRKALPEPGMEVKENLTPARNEVEKKLIEIWAQVLRVEKESIGIDSDFFKLGGHSLKATMLLSAIHKGLNVKIPLAKLFTASTIRELSRYLGTAEKEQFTPIKAAEKKEYHVLSSAQKRLFILNQLESGTISYNIPVTLLLEGQLDRNKFEKTLKNLIKRHESFRTSFEMKEEEPVQKIHDTVDFSIEYFESGEKDAGDIVNRFIRPFDFKKPPVLRSGLIQMGNSPDKHMLMLDMHHIVSDGVSRAILVREFMSLYGGETLPALRVYYKDYSEWQQGGEQAVVLKQQEKYWKNQFEGEIPVLNLPTDFARPMVQNFKGDNLVFFIGKEDTHRLRELAANQQVTLFMLLLALYYLVLSKVSGQEDIVIGTAIEGRGHEDLRGIMGMFVNTLCLRNYPKAEKTFNRFLEEVKNRTLDAVENQQYQFEDLVEAVAVKRDTSRNPLFDVMFHLNNIEISPIRIPGINLKPYRFKPEISKFDMTMTGRETNEEVVFTIDFSTALFKNQTIEILMEFFKEIYLSVVNNPNRTLGEIIEIAPERKKNILTRMNQQLRDEVGIINRGNETLQHELNRNLKTHQHHTAILYGTRAVTYAWLEAKTNYTANWIVNKGINRETPIALFMDDRLELVVVIIGILKAGCVFVPLDSAYPSARLEVMVKSAGIRFIIGNNSDYSRIAAFAGFKSHDVEFSAADELFVQKQGPWFEKGPEIRYRSEDKIYIYFTSGTTGMPAAIWGKNKSLLHFIQWEKETFKINRGFRVSQLTTPGFDAFLRDIFVPICSGGMVCIPGKPAILTDPGKLVNWVEQSCINLIHCVPSLFRTLISFGLTGNHFKALGFVLFSGEKLEPLDLAPWYNTFHDRIQLVNLWGTSETTLAKTSYFIRESDLTGVRIPVGKPISGAGVMVLKKNLQLCDRLETGEIYIWTPFRTRGYVNDPQLNKERFIPNPFNINIERNDLLHKTGDLGRVLPDGNLDVLGRNDRQVKILGIRIELEEIEGVLIKHPLVKEAVVLKKVISNANELLCAYITTVTAPGENIAGNAYLIDTLGDYLSQKLPAYMVPAVILKIDTMPRKPNGKIAYDLLPDPLDEAKKRYIPPANELEMKLAKTWNDILGIEKIGKNSHFFELGGNSLKAMALVAKIHKEFDIRIPLLDVFNTPILGNLAEIIKKGREDKYACVEPVEEKEYYSLSSAQKRMFFLQQVDLETTSYNSPRVVMLEGDVHKEKLPALFKTLIKRHESLRTSFEMIEDERKPMQRIHKNVDIEIEYFDLNRTKFEVKVEEEEGTRGLATSFLPGARSTAAQPEANIIKDFIRPFDLSTAPLFRVGLIKLEKEKHILMVDIHHIISDGVSNIVLIRDLAQLLGGGECPVLKIRYRDYSEWQNRLIEGGDIKQQEVYWLKEFSGEIPVLNLPLDFKRPAVQSFAGGNINFPLGKEHSESLEKLALKEEVTMHMLLLALLNILFSKLSGQEDIVSGTGTAGRSSPDLQQIIGMFVNTLAIRNYPDGKKTFKGFLREVKKHALEAYENQGYPFEELVEKVDVNKDPARNPLFDVMFVLQNMELPRIKFPDLELRPFDYDKRVSKFDITFGGWESGGQLFFTVEYCTHLFKEETIIKFTNYFQKIVDDVLANPGIELGEIEIISREERHMLLYDFNKTAAAYPKFKTIDTMFVEQAQCTPDKIAVSGIWQGAGNCQHTNLQLTYKELNEKSNHLASRLKERGITPDCIVGLMLERSIEMILGVLGILKAGGAYLPLDPEYPEERKRYMIKEGNVKVLLTDCQVAFTSDLIVIDPVTPGVYNHNNECYITRQHTFNSLAYIIYTSGSTGVPKGVMVEHWNVLRLVKNTNYMAFNKGERILQTGALEFDASTFEIWGTLLNGLTIYLVNKENILTAEKLKQGIQGYGITTIWLTAPLFNQILQTDIDVFSGLRNLLVGGDVLSPVHINRLRNRFPALNVINGYGPTENTTFSTTHLIDTRYNENIPIGKPIANSTVYIIDRYLHLQPLNVTGELCVGGDGVARGYLNDIPLTAKKFLFLPFAKGDRIYKTGDLARWLQDGKIEFLGRIDLQVKIRGFRIEPEEIETQILKHEKVKEALVIAKDLQEGKDKYLCAYIITESGFSGEALREYLSGKLPGYMVPRYFIQLKKIPLTPNGKVDTRALPLPGPGQSRGTYVPPGSDVEAVLVNVWQEVLGVERIGITDNFFEIGGDSIKVIQIIARLKKYRLELNVSDLFLNPTIKELGPCLRFIHREIDQSLVVGEVELTPIQRWFFETRFTHRHHFNHSVMIYKEEGFEENLLEKVFTRITTHHDALRMVYQIEGDNVIQRNRDAKRKSFDLEVFNLGKTEDARAEIEKQANRIQQGIDLTTGPLVKLGLFKTGRGHHLLIVVHHLVVDGISWRILLEDFSTGYQQAEQGEEIRFQDKTDSFQSWTRQLKEYAAGKKALQELDYWREIEQISIDPLPKDNQIADEKKKNKNIVKLDIHLDTEETAKLLKEVNWAYNTEINDILLCALGLAVNQWAGCKNVLINLEGHGREPIIKGVDISRTVGWFTAQYPVVLDMSKPGDLSYEIKVVKEALHRVPNKGIGYGILKYLAPDEKKQGCFFAVNPEISFNYLGQFGQDSGSEHIRLSPASTGQSISPETEHTTAVHVSGKLIAGRLMLSLSYNKLEYRQYTFKALAQAFKTNLVKIINHCASKKERELTPVDLGKSDISLETLARIRDHIANNMGKNFEIQLIYPLSPMQDGMLYHSLSKGSKESDPHFAQGIFSIKGIIEPSIFEKSYNMLIERYDILRTVFVYKELDESMQVVLKGRKADLYYEDIAHLSQKDKTLYLEDFMHKDEERGFDLTGDMLMRVSLFRTGSESYKLVWSFHHILMDGWCLGIIFKDFMRLFWSLKKEKPMELEPVTPYINYIKWINRQDRQEGLRYWKDYLEGYNQKADLPRLGGLMENGGYQLEELHLDIDEVVTGRLNGIASANQVTMSTVFQSIWGILLQKYNNCDDVVFGTIVSGRPPEIEGIEHMVGLFINTLPVRIRAGEAQDFSTLLQRVQDTLVPSKSYEYLPLAEIQANSPIKRDLVGHIMAFENFPAAQRIKETGNEEEFIFKVEELTIRGRSNYDLHITVIPGKRIHVKFGFNRNVYGPGFIKKVASHFQEIIRQVVENHGIQLEEIKISHDFLETKSNILGNDQEDWI